MPHLPFRALVTALCLLCGPSFAHEFSPRGLYEIEHRVLDNGLRVVLKPRGDARQVSIRVNVGVGHLDFPCGRRETPHFLEHLLFTGTAQHDEPTLEALVRGWGGTWNAYTMQTRTLYELDIYSGHFTDGLALLHEILTASTITGANVETSREIIRREAGETPGPLRRWTYARGIGKSARDQWLETVGISCRALETPGDITREDIIDAWRRYYVAGNMALVIVGAFDPAVAWPAIETGFGQMPPSPPPERPVLALARPPQALRLESRLFHLLGTEANVFVSFTTPGYRSAERPAVYLLERYLDRRVYESLRVRQGLSYSPASDSMVWPDSALLVLQANAALHTVDTVTEALLEEVRALRAAPPDEATVATLKREALLESATDYETNAGIADYYVASLHELEDHGELVDMEAALAAVTAEDVERAAQRHLDPAHAVTAIERPLLSYEGLFAALAASAGLCVLLAARQAWRRRRSTR